MADFDKIQEALSKEENPVKLQVVTLAGAKTIDLTAGMTVAQIKEDNELTQSKFVTEAGVILGNNDVITEDMTVYVSASKENGTVAVKKN